MSPVLFTNYEIARVLLQTNIHSSGGSLSCSDFVLKVKATLDI